MRFLFFLSLLFTLSFNSVTAQDVSIFYNANSELGLSEIKQQDFEVIEDGFTNGLNNGAYWLKIEPNDIAEIFQLTNNHITIAQAFYQNEEIPVDLDKGFITCDIATDDITYLKLNVNREAYFPYKRISGQDAKRIAIEESVFIGLFYGFALMVFILNIFLYFIFKDNAFILYSLFLFFIIAVFAYRDGFVDIIGFSLKFKWVSEPFIHALGGLAGAAFGSVYLNLKRHYPTLEYSYYLLPIPLSILVIAYLTTGDYIYFLGIDILCLYVFFSCWLSALLLFTAHRYAAIFCLAYFFMLCAATMFYLFPALNIQWIVIEHHYLKWSGYLEMLIITSAVLYRMKILQNEHKMMREEMVAYLSEINYLSQELENAQQGENSIFAQYDLTAREAEILEKISKGNSNKVIADELFISINTVKYHVKKIYEKLEVSNRKEAFQKVKSAS